MEPFQGLACGAVDRFLHFGVLTRGCLLDLAVDFLAFCGSSQAVMQAADQHGPERIVGKFLLQLPKRRKDFSYCFSLARV